jgi:carboxylesterase type B
LDFTNSGKPVLVWIPGGAWYKGSGNGVANAWGPGYFMDRDVVFVTMNYRLGPLGATAAILFQFSAEGNH